MGTNEFAEDYRVLKLHFAGRTEASAPTRSLRVSRLCVGVDAHIDPAEGTVLMEIFGEFDGVKWGDVGIAPYEPPGGAQKSRKGKLHKDQRRFSLLRKRNSSSLSGLERFFFITGSF